MMLLPMSGCVEEKSVELQEITVKLKWLHQAQFAGNYVAVEKGFYADGGLKANLSSFSFEEPTIEAVVDGKADFGIAGANELIVARSEGMPIKAIAAIYKINPFGIVTLKESNITTPYGLVGKKIGLSGGTILNSIYYSMMTILDINRSQIEEADVGFTPVDELLSGNVDAFAGYVTNEPYLVIQAGYEVYIISCSEYGVNIYGDVLFTTEDTVNNNPDLVKCFLRATLEGWQYAIENEEETIDIILEYSTERTKSHETYMLGASIPLIHTGDTPLGWMEKSKWEEVQQILLENKVIDAEINIEDAFTMQFLNKIYEEY